VKQLLKGWLFSKVTHNGLQLGEVADLEVQMFNFCTNVN
jgi:hypothetical protein